MTTDFEYARSPLDTCFPVLVQHLLWATLNAADFQATALKQALSQIVEAWEAAARGKHSTTSLRVTSTPSSSADIDGRLSSVHDFVTSNAGASSESHAGHFRDMSLIYLVDIMMYHQSIFGAHFLF